MTMLIAHVENGGKPEGIAPTILCRAGEEQYGAFPVNTQIHCGMDVEYSTGMMAGGGLLFTAASLAASSAINANNRRKAQAAAKPQWRPWGQFPAIVTNQRLLLMTEQWSSYEFRRLVMIEPDPLHWSLRLDFEDAYPMMLHGPWVPWATVAICASLFARPWPPGFVSPIAPNPAPIQATATIADQSDAALPPGPSAG